MLVSCGHVNFMRGREFLGGRLRKNSDQIVQIRHGTLILTMNRSCEYNYRW